MMEQVSELELDGNIGSYARVRFGQVETGGANGVVIDENKSSTTIKTEIVYWNATLSRLVAPKFGNQQSQKGELLRESTTLSSDLSGDGIIDIPFLEHVYHYEETNENNQYVKEESPYTRWKEYDAAKNVFVNVLDTAINYADGYYLVIPDDSSWIKNAYFTIDKETRTMTFLDLSSNSELFRICVFSEVEWGKADQSGYFEITRANGQVYCCKVSDGVKNQLGGKESDYFRRTFHLIGS